jgi:hypothetical protein
MEYAPGSVFPKGLWRERFLSSISAVTVICATLALAFAVIGLWAARDGGDSGRYFDIAKLLLAGAIVGSTGAAVTSRSGSDRGRGTIAPGRVDARKAWSD